MTQPVTFDFAVTEAARLRLSAGDYAVGKMVDGLPCLVVRDGHWLGGFFENGSFDVKIDVEEPRVAATRFMEWVADGKRSTAESAEATAKWLKATGRVRP